MRKTYAQVGPELLVYAKVVGAVAEASNDACCHALQEPLPWTVSPVLWTKPSVPRAVISVRPVSGEMTALGAPSAFRPPTVSQPPKARSPWSGPS